MSENVKEKKSMFSKLGYLLIAVVLFVIIDGLWITLVAIPQYQNIWETDLLAFKLDGALLLYGVYLCGLLYFSGFFTSLTRAKKCLRAALFGLCAYGTYAFTCYAVYLPYPLWFGFSEFLWGGAISVAVIWILCIIEKAIHKKAK